MGEKMVLWEKRIRKMDGKKRVVKVRTTANGKELVRVLGNRNYKDATAPKGRKRVKGYYNHSDSGKKNYKR